MGDSAYPVYRRSLYPSTKSPPGTSPTMQAPWSGGCSTITQTTRATRATAATKRLSWGPSPSPTQSATRSQVQSTMAASPSWSSSLGGGPVSPVLVVPALGPEQRANGASVNGRVGLGNWNGKAGIDPLNEADEDEMNGADENAGRRHKERDTESVSRRSAWMRGSQRRVPSSLRNLGPPETYLEEDQSDAPWASYKPSVLHMRNGNGDGDASFVSGSDTISMLRSKMYEILDDKTYSLPLYFLQCEYGKLPNRPHIPIALDGDHSIKAQVLLGIGNNPSVPALFWSSSQYFVRAVYSLAQSHNLPPATIYATTARIRRDLTYVGAMVGWLPLDFGIWSGKNELDPQRGEYLKETFPGVDEMWAFWYPMWSKEVLVKEGVVNIVFGPAPSPQPATKALESEERPEPKKRTRTAKLRHRVSACHTQ